MEFLYLFIGWVFGIASPIIVLCISNYYKRKKLEELIFEELKNLKTRLVLLPWLVYSDYGLLDKALIEWMNNQINDINNTDWDNSIKEIFLTINKKEEKDLVDFLVQCNSLKKKDSPGFSFKKMEMGIFNSNLINFELLSKKLLAKILEVNFQISAFNDEIKLVSEYLKMTFDSNISEINHSIIKDSIKKKNFVIANKAKYIVEKINKILEN